MHLTHKTINWLIVPTVAGMDNSYLPGRLKHFMSLSWSVVKFYLGKLLNLAGYPAIVRETEYQSRALKSRVSVKRLELYTLISVNGLDIYFDRFTGKIDGVGTTLDGGCTIPDASIHGSVDFGVPYAEVPQPPIQRQKMVD